MTSLKNKGSSALAVWEEQMDEVGGVINYIINCYYTTSRIKISFVKTEKRN